MNSAVARIMDGLLQDGNPNQACRIKMASPWLPLFVAGLFTASGYARAESYVRLDGEKARVRFVDGDTFQILSGSAKSEIARPVGFNTLEMHGSVHRWGSWSSKDLLSLAKKSRKNASAGNWNCTRHSPGRDYYGRSLWLCLDLAIDQVKKGLAHALSTGNHKVDQAIVNAMRKAIEQRVGIWAREVPHYILTSVHPPSGDSRRANLGLNRLVSTFDGHSFLWRHSCAYNICEEVCSLERDISESEIERIVLKIKKLKIHGRMRSHSLRPVIADYLRLGSFTKLGRSKKDSQLQEALRKIGRKFSYSQKSVREGSCLIFVPFHLRYGKARAPCLR